MIKINSAMNLHSADTTCEIAQELESKQNGYLPNGGAQYGIFLNTLGASVFT